MQLTCIEYFWKGLAEHNKSSEECLVCREFKNMTMELNCGHEKCPVCRKSHILNPHILAENKAKWMANYRKWRSGNAFGAKNEVNSITIPNHKEQPQNCKQEMENSTIHRIKSCPMFTAA